MLTQRYGDAVGVLPHGLNYGCRELVQSTSGRWMVRPGGHLTWRCECGAVTYGPALAEGCGLLDGPARIR